MLSHHDRGHEDFSESWMIGDLEFVGVENSILAAVVVFEENYVVFF